MILYGRFFEQKGFEGCFDIVFRFEESVDLHSILYMMNNFFKRIRKTLMSKKIYSVILMIYRKLGDVYWRLLKKNKDEKDMRQLVARKNDLLKEPKKTYYIIRREDRVGLFSYVHTAMGQVEYALEKGYIPVIDMKTTNNTYLRQEQIGKINAWNFYFEPIIPIDIDEVYTSANYIISDFQNRGTRWGGWRRFF